MKKTVLSYCCCMIGLLLALMPAPWCAGKGPDPSDSKAESISTAPSSSSITAEKRQKLDEIMRQAASDFKAGRFERAVRWYKSALQLDPGREETRRSLEEAQQKLDSQRQTQAQLPQDPAEREKFLKTSFKQATQYYRRKEYDQAYQAFSRIWLAAGDFQGKTLKMKDQCEKLMAEKEASAADAPKIVEKVETATAPTAQANPLKAKPEPQPAQSMEVAASDPAPKVILEQVKITPATPPAKISSPISDPATPAATVEANDAPKLIESKANVESVPLNDPAKGDPSAPQIGTDQAQSASAANTSGPDDLTRLRTTQLLRDAKEQFDAGNFEEARKTVLKAMDLWPDHPQARELLNTLNQKLGTNNQDLANTYAREGDGLAADKKFDEALKRYGDALIIDPNNPLATAGRAKALQRKSNDAQLTDIKSKDELKRENDVLENQALKLYKSGEVRKARELWQKILDQDSQNKLAQTFMEETKVKFERLVADEKTHLDAQMHSEAAEKLLNAPVTISTEQKIALPQFMSLLSFATTSELEYYIAEGANAMIFANFVDRPLREVLDTVLQPIGLSWSINAKNVITIEPKLATRTYNLSPSQISKLRALQDTGQLQKVIWGQSEPPAEGVALSLDERQNMLVVTGSKHHIEKVESLLQSLPSAHEQDMVMRVYKIKESDGSRIKSLIGSIINADKNTPFDLDRKIFIDKGDLIVKDTPENITKIEELLLNNKFIQDLRDEKIDLANFSLVPRNIENTNNEDLRFFTDRVVVAIKTFLYSEKGEIQATDEGRRIFWDPNTLQLTLVDTPTNIARVQKYIDALPELGQKVRQEILFLKYAVAGDLASALERILSLTSGGLNGKNNGNEVVLVMRRGDSRQFRNLRLRVIRVDRTNPNDLKSDTVELSIDDGSNVSQLQLRNLDTQYQGDYQLVAESVLASGGHVSTTANGGGGDPGEGRARIRVKYVPQGLTQQQILSGQATADNPANQSNGPDQTKALEDNGIAINPFPELNALIIRYSDPALYQDAIHLIEQLDKPQKQVSIETKFVEVNETRAKEFGADFNIEGLGSGRSVDWGTQMINSRFAQDVDQWSSPYNPPLVSPASAANLLSGPTAIDAVIGSFPYINLQLRFLEAEGILNVINGPKVTALDMEEADFRIEEYEPQQTQLTQNTLQTIINPLDQAYNSLRLADQDVTNPNMVNAVHLRMTPTITSTDSIRLDHLYAELLDFEGYIGSSVNPIVQNVTQTATGTNQTLFSTILPTQATVYTPPVMLLKRKYIETTARIKNGGTIVIGGWTGERTQELTTGIPCLRNMPYFGKLLFSKAQRASDRTTLMIFLTGNLID